MSDWAGGADLPGTGDAVWLIRAFADPDWVTDPDKLASLIVNHWETPQLVPKT